MPVLAAASAGYEPSATARSIGTGSPSAPPVPAIQMSSNRIAILSRAECGAATGAAVTGNNGKLVTTGRTMIPRLAVLLA
ncbi:hypothetical protein KRM28CT15_16590 [Krasilnikovia sp. M28-CT-15]